MPNATAHVVAERRGLRRIGMALRRLAVVAVVAIVWPLPLGGMFGAVIVSGHSMEPTLMPGDLIVVKRIEDASVGDVVVYRPPTEPRARVVHRVVERDGTTLELQGDNNHWRDPFDVDQEDVVAEVQWRIPRIGGYLFKLANPIVGFSLLLVGTGWWLATRRSAVTM